MRNPHSPFALLFVPWALLLAAPLLLAQEPALPARIEAERENLFPEGVEYDPTAGRFLLGSLAEGDVFVVEDDGTTTRLIEDDDLLASTGLEVDALTNRLLVANADPGAFNPFNLNPGASLGIYDLATGARLRMVDLRHLRPGRHFPNDVAVDDDGNAYVTDSFAAVVYRVTPEGEASVFAQDEQFAGGLLTLNGIVWHPDGYLIVAQAGKGELYKIPLASPEKVTSVTLPEPVSGADGLALHPDGSLIVISGSLSTVFRLRSDDGWASARIEGRVKTDEPATTAAVRDGAVYVLYSRMRAMNFGQTVASFPIVRVDFE